MLYHALLLNTVCVDRWVLSDVKVTVRQTGTEVSQIWNLSSLQMYIEHFLHAFKMCCYFIFKDGKINTVLYHLQ